MGWPTDCASQSGSRTGLKKIVNVFYDALLPTVAAANGHRALLLLLLLLINCEIFSIEL